MNQCVEFSHRLLQSLILHHKCRQPSVVVQMYLNGTIELSQHSLETLQVLFRSCDLPETAQAFHSIPSGFSVHRNEPLRSTLLNWLLPDKADFSITEVNLVPFAPLFMSRVLVELTVKCQDSDTSRDPPAVSTLIENSIQDDYMMSSFEMGLLTADECGEIVSEADDTRLVISSVRDTLMQLLIRDCNILIEREFNIPDPHTKLNVVFNYISECKLVSSVLSWMLRWNIIKSHALPTFRLVYTHIMWDII